jgi:protein disulfide-isomerase A1
MQFLFALADRQEYMRDLDRLQLNTNRVFLSLKDKEGKLYVLKETKLMVDDQKIKQEAITKFIDNYLGGKVSPYIRSEEVPDEDFDRNVRVVVGENFQNAIMDAKTNVVLLVYSTIYPGSATQDANIHETLSKVGEVFKDSEDVLIAKVEGTLNEIYPHYKSHTYPKIYFLPVEKKHEPVVFEGAVTVDELVKFVRDEVDKVKKAKAEAQQAQDKPESAEQKKDL